MASNTFMGVGKTAWVLLALLLATGTARADLTSGKNKFLTGDYKGALTDLGAVGGGDKPAAQLLLGRVQLRVGAYPEAEKIARELQKAKDAAVANDATVLLAEVLRAVGRTAEARKELEPLVAKFPDPKKADHMRARWQLALTLRDLGQTKLAQPIFDLLGDLYNSLDPADAEKLFYAAEGFRATEDFEDANGTYHEAVAADARLLEANVRWASCRWGAERDAEDSSTRVLRSTPTTPTPIGMARSHRERRRPGSWPLPIVRRWPPTRAMCRRSGPRHPGHRPQPVDSAKPRSGRR
jgi:tetratricopeptide (TPR) repeat protein